MNVGTKAELAEILNELNITDEEREIATMVLSRRWSYTKIAMETGHSKRNVARIMERVYMRL